MKLHLFKKRKFLVKKYHFFNKKNINIKEINWLQLTANINKIICPFCNKEISHLSFCIDTSKKSVQILWPANNKCIYCYRELVYDFFKVKNLLIKKIEDFYWRTNNE